MPTDKKKEMPHCAQCGRLFRPRPGHDKCLQCEPGQKHREREVRVGFIRRLAERLGFAPEAIVETIGDAPVEEETRTEPRRCVLCDERPALEDGALCLECKVIQYRSLGEAARDVKSRIHRKPPEFGRYAGSVRQALQEKETREPLPPNDTPTIVQLR